MKHFTSWMNENRRANFKSNCKALVLADGTTLSVQASNFHYCQPRIDIEDYSQYAEFEIGYPSVKIDEIMPYVEDEENPTDTVYAWVPKAVIEHLIESRGGVVGVQD